MTKMAAMPIYGKTLQKSSLQELLNLLQRKLDMLQLRLEYYNVFINHYHVMTLIFLRQGQHRSRMQKTIKLTLKGKTFRKWASGQNI